MKLISEGPPSYRGFCVFTLHHNGFGVSPRQNHDRLPSVTRRYAEWLIVRLRYAYSPFVLPW
jgi:hypothetical protein